MLRWFCLAACIYLIFAGAMAQAQTVTLRPRIEASGPSVTMGDVFAGAPADVAARTIGPAPAPGQISVLPVPLLVAVASAADLQWTPPAGVAEVRVVRPGGARATLPPPSASPAQIAASSAPFAQPAIRRGDLVTVVYRTSNLELARTGLRALDAGAAGQTIRLQNGAGTISAVVTGPGAAEASP